jgi:outer membrane biosynthesis protein TonB
LKNWDRFEFRLVDDVELHQFCDLHTFNSSIARAKSVPELKTFLQQRKVTNQLQHLEELEKRAAMAKTLDPSTMDESDTENKEESRNDATEKAKTKPKEKGKEKKFKKEKEKEKEKKKKKIKKKKGRELAKSSARFILLIHCGFTNQELHCGLAPAPRCD